MNISIPSKWIVTEKKHFTRFLARVLLLPAILCASAYLHGQWQWPQKGENLKVLPADSSAAQIRTRMFEFTNSLGVRCDFCHVGEDPMDLSTFNFAADDKPTKRTARIMLRMVQAINDEHLSQLTSRDAQVRCVTCHSGVSRPKPLEDVLAEVVGSGGAEAAAARYKELKERYYGRGTYDFGETTLLSLARSLASSEKNVEAIEIARLNLENFPESANTHMTLGRLYAAVGDRETAIRHLEKAVELNPNDPRPRALLRQLQQQ